MFGLTPDEKKVIIFFIAALALGNAVLLYKKSHPTFAPELKYGGLRLPEPQAAGVPAVPDQAEVRDSGRYPAKKILAGRIDINQAGSRDLERLPSIGPAMAKRIIDYRQNSGGFRQVEDLMKVKGIGHKKFNRLREHVFVDH
mgnify:CR=1 FL=1